MSTSSNANNHTIEEHYEIKLVTKASILAREAKKTQILLLLREARKDKRKAASQGDARENAGLKAAKENMVMQDRRLFELAADNGPTQEINTLDWENNDMDGLPRVMIGVVVKFQRQGLVPEELLIGGAWDNFLENNKVIPYDRPLAKALIPKRPGQTVQLITKEHTTNITILSVHAPSKELLEQVYGFNPQV